MSPSGFMCGTNVLDKDGISACVVLAELACYLAQTGVTLTQQLENIFRKYVVVFDHVVMSLPEQKYDYFK